MVLSTVINQINMGYTKRLGQVILKDKSETRQIIDILYAKGFISGYKSGDTEGPYSIGVQIPITPCNIRNRMLWVDLKYRNGTACLKKMSLVSKPSRRVFASLEELKAVKTMKGMEMVKREEMGQVTIVKTLYGILELDEALEKGVGGEVLCYAV